MIQVSFRENRKGLFFQTKTLELTKISTTRIKTEMKLKWQSKYMYSQSTEARKEKVSHEYDRRKHLENKTA